MKSIELIVSDLDGTLVYNENSTNQVDVETIKSLQSDDYKFTIATGRTFQEAKKFSELFELTNNLDLIICNNGALVSKASEFSPLFVNEIDFDTTLKVFEISKDLNIAFFSFANDGKVGQWNGIEITPNKLIEENWLNEFEVTKFKKEKNDDNKILQLVLFVPLEQEKEFLEKTNGLRNDLEFNKTILGNVIFYCLNQKKSSKGEGLKFLTNYLKIDLKNVIAFGDDFNDLSLFEIVGESVAMDNASDQVKNKATTVTKKVNDSGVSDYLNYLMTSLD